MYREFFARSPLLGLPLLSLVIFITVFALLVVRAMRRRPASFEPLANLPLELEREDGDALVARAETSAS